MFSILVGLVLSKKCYPCLPWPPESTSKCITLCREISDEEYCKIMTKYAESVIEYYSRRPRNPSKNTEIIKEKTSRCYPSHCYISISNPRDKMCTKDCGSKPGKTTWID